MKEPGTVFKVLVCILLIIVVYVLLRIWKMNANICTEMKSLNESVSTVTSNSDATRREWKDAQKELINKGLLKEY